MLGHQLALIGGELVDQRQRCIGAGGEHGLALRREAIHRRLGARRVIGLGLQRIGEGNRLGLHRLALVLDLFVMRLEDREELKPPGAVEVAKEEARNELCLGQARIAVGPEAHIPARDAAADDEEVEGQRGDQQRLQPVEAPGGRLGSGDVSAHVKPSSAKAAPTPPRSSTGVSSFNATPPVTALGIMKSILPLAPSQTPSASEAASGTAAA